MRKAIIKNIIIFVIFIILPLMWGYYVGHARLTWSHRSVIRSITNYTSVIISSLAGAYIIIANIKAFQQKNTSTAFLIACGLFIVLGLAAVVYSLFMLIVLLAFRNGINF